MQAFLPRFLEFVNSHILEGVNLFNYNRMESMIAQSGKTKLHLCRAMGVSKTYLRDAKKQGTDISGEKLRILAAELNTTPEYLRGETDDPGIKKERPADGEALNVDEWIKKARTMSNGDLNLALRELLKIQAERIAEDERTEH